MSVILNALKKSEQERRAGRAPSAPAPAASPPPATRTWPWLAAAGAALGVAAVVIVVVGAVPWRPASPPSPVAATPVTTGANAALRSDDPRPPATRAAMQRAPARPTWPVPMAAVARHPRPPHHGAAPKPITVTSRAVAIPVRAVTAIAAPPRQSRPVSALSPSRPAVAPRRQIAAKTAAPPAPLANVATAPRPRAPSPAPATTVADMGDQSPVTRAEAAPLAAVPTKFAAIARPEPLAEATATPNMAAAPVVPVAIEAMAEAPRHLAALDRPVGPGDAARPVPPAAAVMPTEAGAAPAPLVEAAAPPPQPPNRPRPRPRNVLDPYATVPMLATLPHTFVSSVPRMALSLHVYDKEPGNRLVRLNGKTYREGDVTADGMTLDAIVPNGLVLRYEGRQFRVRM